MQKYLANGVEVNPAYYSRLEKGEREFGMEVIDRPSKFLCILLMNWYIQTINFPKRLKWKIKTAVEKIHLISQFDEKYKNAVYRIMNNMLVKSKFQTFFEQNNKVI